MLHMRIGCFILRISRLALAFLAVLASAGCVPLAAPPSLPPNVSSLPPPRTITLADAPAATGQPLAVYAPATPSSVPVIFAARRMGANVTIYTNQSQANTLFLRGDIPILVTGLSVGVEFFKNGVPVQVIDSYVAGLTYLVTYGKPVTSLAQLKGQEIYIPFKGSPIEETTQFFAEREGLAWPGDLMPKYAPFVSSVELLKQGKAAAVALPEPFVTLVEKQDRVFVSLSYKAEWARLTGSTSGYPQVATFVKRDWAEAHPEIIARFNKELALAVQDIGRDPAAATVQTHEALGLSQEVLARALHRTEFAFQAPDAAAADIRHYYETIGKPLDETFGAFFYRSPQ